MIKEARDIIFTMVTEYLSGYDFNLKKIEDGVKFILKKKNFGIDFSFGFAKYLKMIEYKGAIGSRISILEVEDIYKKIMTKNGVEVLSETTINLFDDEWLTKKYSETGTNTNIDLPNNSAIQAHTQKILERFETYMLPKAEQYLSLPYWAQHYEKKKENLYDNNEPDSFYRLVNDNYSLKHLIILKLCGSPSFEEAYEIRTRPTFEYLDSNPDQSDKMYEGACRFKNVLLDLKATLNATPAKYDYRDTTPPYKFIKKTESKPVEAKPSRTVMIDDRAVNVEINAFEISVEQQAKIDSFLKHIQKHFEAIREVIIDNAEFENEQGKLQNFEDCSYVIQDIAEAKGLLNGQKLGFERAAAQYLYLKEIAIDPDQNQVTGIVASDFSEIKLTALLDLSGHVEIVYI